MLKFAPIMLLLLLYSYYANNFASKIDASLVTEVMSNQGNKGSRGNMGNRGIMGNKGNRDNVCNRGIMGNDTNEGNKGNKLKVTMVQR